MLRLFIIAFLCYLGYVVASKYLKAKDKELPKGNSSSDIVDELVEDPICHKYIPKRNAFSRKIDGYSYYFCSMECAEMFKKKLEEEGEKS
jgi:YHS domain-containing protein